MYQLLETIKCRNGKLINIKWHNQRFNYARKKIWGFNHIIRLEDLIQIPQPNLSGLFRCRVVYSPEIEKIEFIPYSYRKIESLKLVEANDIDYSFKYANRKKLDNLFALRDNCDDILIVKNGCITDSYTANPVFYDGKDWFTPGTVLLAGTQRARLLAEKKIRLCEITLANLSEFKKIGLINAFWNLRNMPVVEMGRIVKQ